MKFSETTQDKGLVCAKGIADWLCIVQQPRYKNSALTGSFPYIIYPDGNQMVANNWNMAFASMGMLSAYKTFDDSRYEEAAISMGHYLKALQIFDPFKKEHYGAIREITPQTPWCYTRDALSAAWSFLELYRYTNEEEYLERAILWAEWFLRKGCDEDGWPYWGHQFEPYVVEKEPQMCNDVQGSFQGGSLNFFYHLAEITGDKKWTGDFFVRMANFFIEHIQQPSGIFLSIENKTKKPPESDPQYGLHRANDDLGTLGLLCAYRVTGDKRYLAAIQKFLNAVFAVQLEDGRFEDSVACIPVILNILHESAGLVDVPLATTENVERALNALLIRQSDGKSNPLTQGGIIENDAGLVCARSGCYALIVLLKLFADSTAYLTEKTHG